VRYDPSNGEKGRGSAPERTQPDADKLLANIATVVSLMKISIAIIDKPYCHLRVASSRSVAVFRRAQHQPDEHRVWYPYGEVKELFSHHFRLFLDEAYPGTQVYFSCLVWSFSAARRAMRWSAACHPLQADSRSDE